MLCFCQEKRSSTAHRTPRGLRITATSGPTTDPVSMERYVSGDKRQLEVRVPFVGIRENLSKAQIVPIVLFGFHRFPGFYVCERAR